MSGRDRREIPAAFPRLCSLSTTPADYMRPFRCDFVMPSNLPKRGLDSVVRSGVYTDNMEAGGRLTISRLARLGGVNLETVRFYEREGLIPKPPRTGAGYRVFPANAARRLRFIKRAQELGFSLTEIRELLSLRPSTDRPKVRARAQAKIAGIDQKIQSLEAMKRVLGSLIDRCDHCGPKGDCPILESLDREETN